MPTYRVQSSKGKNAAYHITIPLEYRTALGIQKGDRLECWRDGDTIVYRKVQQGNAATELAAPTVQEGAPAANTVVVPTDEKGTGISYTALEVAEHGRFRDEKNPEELPKEEEPK